MLRSVNEILGYKIGAQDGDMGTVDDFYFDDREWIIRYLVADTRRWLPGRQVLISPVELGEPQWNDRILQVSLSKDQIKESPEVDADLPVSRQKEAEMVAHFGWIPYWEPLGAPGSVRQLQLIQAEQQGGKEEEKDWDPHLRSLKEVCRYHIRSSDDERIGSVKEFIAETEGWIVRYVIVDTGKWLSGRKVLVSPMWVKKVDEAAREVQIDLPAQQIKDGPEFNPAKPVNREYEIQLYDFYGRPTYWD
jgi:hypothetical protein